MVLEEREASEPVHMGGINMYLQQKSRLFRLLPRWLADRLDSPRLLRWASRRGNLTEAPDLGAMAVSMLRGEDGRQAKELEKLVEWAASVDRPDVIVLSNVMLSPLARRLNKELDRPVVTTLQGEAPFLDGLPAPYSREAWEVLARRAADVDAFVAVSAWYGEVMRERLGLTAERVHVVHNGLDLEDLPATPTPLAERRPKAIGYLARMCADKGLPTLVEAFLLLRERGRVPGLRLRVAGVMLNEDRPLVEELQARLRAKGCQDDAEFHPNVDRAEKLAFLQSLSVLSVPATYGESFGLYLLEAMASGVPVVQPRHAAFPEVLEATGGGVLCEPNDPSSLADALEDLLLDEAKAQALATRGGESVREHFAAEHMARAFEQVCRMVARADAPQPQVVEPEE
jgi:glycosyltransferase involved in cell wall biosynthesis